MAIRTIGTAPTGRIESMSLAKRKALLEWCKSHDWGVACYYNDSDGSIDGLVDSSGDSSVFTSFTFRSKLRTWAGY
jgi:hypothetical protein